MVTKTVPESTFVRQTDLFAFSDPVSMTGTHDPKSSFMVVPTCSIKAALYAYQSVLFMQGISTMITHQENYPEPGQFTVIVTENKRFGKIGSVVLT